MNGEAKAAWIVRAHGWLVAPAADFAVARAVFLRALGVIYAIAFASFGVQARGLIGEDGILPVAPTLRGVRERLDFIDLAQIPTVFWLGASDGALVGASVLGVLLGVAVTLGFGPRWALFGAWSLYLSIVTIGSPFMDFQWDLLLLETGLLAIALAPPGLWPERRGAAPPPRWALVVFWFLLFKLMVLSGVVKLLSGDPTWRDFTALQYHYWSQPLPTWTSAYVHALPGWVHRVSTFVMYAIELGAPVLIFFGRGGRRFAALALTSLQLIILSTGNYGFFNYLTAALGILLVDDVLWARLFPAAVMRWLQRPAIPSRFAGLRREAGLSFALAHLTLSASEMVFSVLPNHTPALARAWARTLAPLRSINSYGLFRVMTTTRPEIILEGTIDGVQWRPYELRWKPGDVTRPPRFVAPHQPRLDWQMWFAALGQCMHRSNQWVLALQLRLLEGNERVLSLFEGDPFDGELPQKLRTTVYEYRFASPEERSRTGAFWTRTRTGPYCPALALQDGELIRVGP